MVVSKASGTELIGLNGESFTASAGTFFVQDTGTVTINTLGFTDVSDSFVSELVYNKAQSSMKVFGAFELTGSDTDLVYTLNGFNGSNSSIVMSNIKFDGSNTSVLNDAANSYKLTNSGTAAFNITGTLKDVSSFTMLSTADNGEFLFGEDSNTGITFVGSGSGISNATAIFGAGAFAASNTVTVVGGLLHIEDATGSEGYKVYLNDGSMNGATISEIDSGATIYQVASATSVITTSIQSKNPPCIMPRLPSHAVIPIACTSAKITAP